MNVTLDLAKQLEQLECLGRETFVGKICTRGGSQADHLLQPWRMMAFNPGISSIIILIAWILISIVTFPLWVISFLITPLGSLALVLGVAVWAARWFARSMAFPGSTNSMQRTLALDYMNRLSTNIEQICQNKVSNFTASVTLIASERSTFSALIDSHALDEVQGIIVYFKAVVVWVNEAIKEEITAGRVTAEEVEDAVQLNKSLSRIIPALTDLHAAVKGDSSANDINGNGSNSTPAALVTTAGRVLQAVVALKSAAVRVLWCLEGYISMPLLSSY